MLTKKFQDNLSISIDQSNSIQVIDAIREGINEYNIPYVIEAVSAPFAIYAQDKHNIIVGGIVGFHNSRYAKITLTWVSKDNRKQNIATRMLELLEIFLAREGCVYIQTEVFEHQTKEFYEKHAFKLVATIKQWKENYDCHFMKKQLNSNI